MKLAYIIGPYRADTPEKISENIAYAASYAQKYWALGYTVICPHTNSAHFSSPDIPEHFFLNGYKDMLRNLPIYVCIAIPGWTKSSESRDEVFIAERKGIPVIYET